MKLSDIDAQVVQAELHMQRGEVLQAELVYRRVLDASPGHKAAARALSQLALLRGDSARAAELLSELVRAHPNDAQLALDHAVALAQAERLREAIAVVEASLAFNPKHFPSWLLLGHIREAEGDSMGALRAWYQAVTGAQREGHWKDQSSTPPNLLEPVVHAIERVRAGRRELLFDVYETLRAQHGASALQRVDRALSGYLKEWDSTPVDSRQRPRFFFFSDLPNTPYLDPYLQPWAKRLEASFAAIREEAIRVWTEGQRLQDFLELSDSARLEDYLRGDGVTPAWEAFFFYRHGHRFDANHSLCPRTSEVLESIELCRIEEQAPEICFSVLKPRSHIMPHYGVTNVRLVMHLPLLVPPDCALNLIDVGEHHWQEGKLMMFDDTFQHEAWNRSDETRIVLLMDCWNPHLTGVEQLAVKQLIEMISRFHLADRAPNTPNPTR